MNREERAYGFKIEELRPRLRQMSDLAYQCLQNDLRRTAETRKVAKAKRDATVQQKAGKVGRKGITE